MTITSTRTRTHVYTEFANPHLRCGRCGDPVRKWHNDNACGCNDTWYNVPCGCTADVTSNCLSWDPVDGCTCNKKCE